MKLKKCHNKNKYHNQSLNQDKLKCLNQDKLKCLSQSFKKSLNQDKQNKQFHSLNKLMLLILNLRVNKYKNLIIKWKLKSILRVIIQ